MNDVKKLLAILAVGLMLAAGSVCTIGFSGADEVETTTSDKPVVIDVNGSYEENKAALVTLGITHRSAWTWDDGYNCYKLVLSNVNHVAKANNAVTFLSKSTASNPTLVVELEGVNNVVADTTGTTKDYSMGILATHYLNGQHMKDFRLILTGHGMLNVSCTGTSKTVEYSTGLDVFGSLTMLDETIVRADAARIDYIQQATTDTDGKRIFSVGVCAYQLHMRGSDSTVPLIIGIGADVDVNFVGASLEGKTYKLYSAGIRASEYDINGAGIVGKSGVVSWTETADDNVKSMNAFSLGIDSILADDQPLKVSLKNTLMYGEGSDVEGLSLVNSHGIYLQCDDGSTINVDNSILVGESGDFYASKNNNDSSSEGIKISNKLIAKNSLLSGSSGTNVFGNGTIYASGIHFNAESSLTGCIICAVSNANHCDESYGIRSNGLTITDTDIYASGHGGCTDSVITIPKGYILFNSVDYNGDLTPLTGTEITKDITSVELAYKYDVVYLGVHHAVYFDRLTDNEFVLGEYEGPQLDAWEFDHWVVNGEPAQVGDTIVITGLTIVKGAFVPVHKKTDDGNNSWIAWVALAIAILAIVALIGTVCYVRAR